MKKISVTTCHKSQLLPNHKITQVSEEIEGRITKKIPKDFSRMENLILSTLSRLDKSLLNPLLQGHSRSATESSQNALNINQGTNEDDSQVDIHPETRVSRSQGTHIFGPDNAYNMVTGVQEQIPDCSPGLLQGNKRRHNSATIPQ